VPPREGEAWKRRREVMLCQRPRVAPRQMPEKPVPMQANWV
jgi:hypothetical protein